jgi:hypothetical protein
MKVFLSYSRRDAEFVDRLGRQLSGRGYDVWVDREDVVGGGEDRWRRSIVRAIRDSDVVILVLSPNSAVSENVERELSVAADNARRLIPVLLRECQMPDGFQYELAGLQYVDFSILEFDEAMRQLAVQLGPAGPPIAGDTDSSTTRPSPSTRLVTPTELRGYHGRRHRLLSLLVGAFVLVFAIGAIVLASTLDGDDETGTETVAPGVTMTSATTTPDPTVAAAPTTTHATTTLSPTTLPPATTLPPTTTLPATTVPPTLSPDPEAVALQQLQTLIASDAPLVASVSEHWVPQLGAKQLGTVWQGVTYDYQQILTDHQQFRDLYGAVLVDGTTYYFRQSGEPMAGWFITLLPQAYADADGALAWCTDQRIDRDNCFAKLLTQNQDPGQTVRQND